MPVIKKLLVIVALMGFVPLFARSEENALSDSEKKKQGGNPSSMGRQPKVGATIRNKKSAMVGRLKMVR